MLKDIFFIFLTCATIFHCNNYASSFPFDTQNTNKSSLWEDYYQNTLNSTDPHKTLLLALKYFKMENINQGKAADLGAGTGKDSLFLLKSNWQVFALDAEQLSIDIILSRVDPQDLLNLEIQVAPFSNMTLPKELNLINACYSLPFCNPNDFEKCWETIVNSLAIGGRFCGQFFGVNDEWSNNPNLTVHSYENFMRLFQSQFIIEYLQIEDGLLPCASGSMKHWHVYHVVAKKIK